MLQEIQQEFKHLVEKMAEEKGVEFKWLDDGNARTNIPSQAKELQNIVSTAREESVRNIIDREMPSADFRDKEIVVAKILGNETGQNATFNE